MPDQEQTQAGTFPDDATPEASPETETQVDQSETIDVLNQASRETETVTFSRGPGDTVMLHHGNDVVIISADHFQEVINWFEG